MVEKVLGKIDFAEYGTVNDYPFLIGLQLGFRFPTGGVGCGYRYTVNISPDCNWGDDSRVEVITKNVEFVNKTLEDAKVNYVSQLISKPVEIIIEDNTFKDFRILTEVL